MLVTYRGVKYDTQDKQICETKEVKETYRGVTYTKKVRVCK